jgi:hypothetical protein
MRSNWGIGIGIAGKGPYSLDQKDSDFASDIIVRNMYATKTRQCIHFEVSRNFIVENVEVYPDSNVSLNAGLTFSGLAFYGCRDLSEGCKVSLSETVKESLYVAWGQTTASILHPAVILFCLILRLRMVLLRLPPPVTNDVSNGFH